MQMVAAAKDQSTSPRQYLTREVIAGPGDLLLHPGFADDL
jgi:hypothetical protein